MWGQDISVCFDQVKPDQKLTQAQYNSFPEQIRDKYYGFGSFSQRQWMYDDGYIKIAMTVFAIFCFLLRLEAYEHRRLILSGFGITFQLYWLFEIGWLISAAVKFWGQTERSTCGTFLYRYMWARLIGGFLVAVIGLVVYSFRSTERDYFITYHPKHLYQPHENIHVSPVTGRRIISS